MMQPRLYFKPTLCSACSRSMLPSRIWHPSKLSRSKTTSAVSSKRPTRVKTIPKTKGIGVYIGKNRILEQSGTHKVIRYVPRTPGMRHLVRPVNDHLWRGKPYKPLTYPKKGHARGGRNNTGKITVRHRGGGHARRVRTVDFQREDPGTQEVERIEYDPNRSAHIALVCDEKGKRSYILAADGLRAGDRVESFRKGFPKKLLNEMGTTYDPGMLAARTIIRGNCLPLYLIPIGTTVFNVGIRRDSAGIFCRSAGTCATVIDKDNDADKISVGKYVTVKLQSGEVRKVSSRACATIGVASNPGFQHRQLGKAGRARWLGIRPTVRGVAMNSVDHPHGGGRGKSKGNVKPCSPWGVLAKSGYKTRQRRRPNDMVVTPRPRNHGKRRAKA